jgi:predicted RNA-binding protein YlxR (DUF448 family)
MKNIVNTGKMTSSSPQYTLIKHKPQRTCIACRRLADKRELIRLVRTAGGSVEVDVGGKESGRGAYLCRSRSCWQTGLKGDRLERVLRTTITEDNRRQLVSRGEELMLGADCAKNE